MAGTSWKYTDELRERTVYLASYGVPGPEIAKIIGCEAKSTVNNMIRVAKLVESDQLEEAKAISITACKSLAGFEWACKKYGKKLPEPEPKPEEPKEIPVINNPPIEVTKPLNLAEIRNAVNDAIKENCKDAKIEQIDKDQMARIMYALAKIDERLEMIETYIDTMQTEQHNDIKKLCDLVSQFNNNFLLEMRKKK